MSEEWPLTADHGFNKYDKQETVDTLPLSALSHIFDANLASTDSGS